jgi:hypothetical protein
MRSELMDAISFYVNPKFPSILPTAPKPLPSKEVVMIASIVRLLRIIFRERPIELKPGVRYRATLHLAKVRPGMSESDVRNWLMTMGFSPTAKPEVWKADEKHLSRLPRESIAKAEKL